MTDLRLDRMSTLGEREREMIICSTVSREEWMLFYTVNYFIITEELPVSLHEMCSTKEMWLRSSGWKLQHIKSHLDEIVSNLPRIYVLQYYNTMLTHTCSLIAIMLSPYPLLLLFYYASLVPLLQSIYYYYIPFAHYYK